MPNISGKNIGAPSVAKAMANLEERYTVGDTLTQDTTFLLIPGLPKLTFQVISESVPAIEVRVQAALRRVGVGQDLYDWQTIAPVALVSSAAPFLFEVSYPGQAMRLRLTNNSGGPLTVRTYLMAAA